MPSSFLPLLLFFVFSLFHLSLSQVPPNGILIDCGVNDGNFISTGSPKNLTPTPNLVPILSTVRSFPLSGGIRRKFCYNVRAFKGDKYLIRTTYFYGGVNGNALPPVFDQIVDGTFWGVVNTTEDYLKGNASYFEGVFMAKGGRGFSICLAANVYTDSDPFISGLELVRLDASLYNSTDFANFGLRLVARHSFGYNGPIIRYPDDPFDRYWEAFGENNPTISATNVSIPGFWNLPPLKCFQTKLSNSQPEALTFQWPPGSLQNSTYYIALYFADDRDSSSGVPRVQSVSINNIEYIRDLKVIPHGVVVYANQWLLAGPTTITLTPAAGSTVGPLINAGEIFEVIQPVLRTHTKDVIALELLKKSLSNPPFDWSGDPCLPSQYSWTGVTCSGESRIRVTMLNLTSMGLSGSLSPSIANLTALTEIWLGSNSLSGSIPDLSSLTLLEKLHLEDNKLTGMIPPSLENMGQLRELFVQQNNLTGQVPNKLLGNPRLDFRFSPGNPFLSSPPPS